MRTYEELFIIQPDATDEQVDQVIEQISATITQGGGRIEKVDKWGKRRLAYKVNKHKEGIYVLLQFDAKAEAVKELERRLRVIDSVVKYLTVRIDQTLKRLDKRRKQREKRASRKPQMTAPALPLAPGPAPALPAPAPAPMMPGVPEEKEA
ncbi:MAG: 30S ribosomal protein S6 [Bryobacteraceae bacterium]